MNAGAIYKYVTKPWDPPQLEMTLKRGLEFFMVQQERDGLLKEKMAVLRHIMVADRVVSLGLLAAGLSHHIRNSLVAVKTFLDLALRWKLEEEQAETEFRQIARNPDFWMDYRQNALGQVDKINDLLKDLWLVSEKSALPFHRQRPAGRGDPAGGGRPETPTGRAEHPGPERCARHPALAAAGGSAKNSPGCSSHCC